MKKVLLALALMVLLSVLASAENDSVTTGPYKISFDIGFNHSDYNVTVNAPTETEDLSGNKSTVYKVTIKNNPRLMNQQKIDITLTHFEKDQERLPIDMRAKVFEIALLNINLYSNVDAKGRIIDGVEGIAASADLVYSGQKIKTVWANYYPAFDWKRLDCFIMSTYPWDKGSLQLLKTISIEKLNVTKKQSV